MPTDHAAALKLILAGQLGRNYPPDAFTEDTPLLGTIPELDSMAAAAILTAMQDELGITIDDDEINAEIFYSFGSLLGFVRAHRDA